MESGLYAWLTADATLTALLGGRVYPDAAPAEADTPYAVYETVADEDVQPTFRGASGVAAGRFDVTVYGDSKAQVKPVTKRIRAMLKDFRPGLWGAYRVVSARADDERSNAEGPQDGSDRWAHAATLTLAASYYVTPVS